MTTILDKFTNWAKKSRGELNEASSVFSIEKGYHEHDGWPRHPAQVKYHKEYFEQQQIKEEPKEKEIIESQIAESYFNESVSIEEAFIPENKYAGALRKLGRKMLKEKLGEEKLVNIATKIAGLYNIEELDLDNFEEIYKALPSELTEKEQKFQKAVFALRDVSRTIFGSEPRKVYRGLELTKAQLKKFHTGEDIKLRNTFLSSWTTEINIAKEFIGSTGSVITQIVSAEDVMMIPMLTNLDLAREFEGQKEIVLMSDDRQQVVKVAEVINL